MFLLFLVWQAEHETIQLAKGDGRGLAWNDCKTMDYAQHVSFSAFYQISGMTFKLQNWNRLKKLT